VMTVAHLFFALVTTAYILVAIKFEERDLAAVHGARYERYREQVPMLIPSARAHAAEDEGASAAA
jgi:protein-S-isoprenylcysteine O-methyltransferase Ste14